MARGRPAEEGCAACAGAGARGAGAPQAIACGAQPPGPRQGARAPVFEGGIPIKAYRLLAWGRAPELCDVPVPEPGPGEVLVKVAGAGACHTDLHIMDRPPHDDPYERPPFTLGHENAGWVEALGAGVRSLSPGDPVAVAGAWGCGHCRACRQGREMLCENLDEVGCWGGGLGRDGGIAEYLLVPAARLLLPLGDLDPRSAGPLTDAALTPYHAVKAGPPRLHPGAWALVIGVGGLGHVAVQLHTVLCAARVAAVDVGEAKLALARELGAEAAVPAGPTAAAELRELTGGRGARLVLDFVGSTETMALAAACAAPGGAIQVVGLGGGTLPVAAGGLPFDCSLTTPYWGSTVELAEVLDLARAGRIHLRTERFALAQADEAYARLRAGTLLGRAVITPNG
jgi:alcohol dehydrogenase, propanol-preferring